MQVLKFPPLQVTGKYGNIFIFPFQKLCSNKNNKEMKVCLYINITVIQ